MPPGKRFENWVVNKVLSRWQKLWSRQRRKKKNLHHRGNLQVLKVQVTSGVWGHGPWQKCLNLGLLECISGTLEQKLECLNRTQTSLNFGFCGGHFQRKVGGKFMRNSWLLLRTLGGKDWSPSPLHDTYTACWDNVDLILIWWTILPDFCCNPITWLGRIVDVFAIFCYSSCIDMWHVCYFKYCVAYNWRGHTTKLVL